MKEGQPKTVLLKDYQVPKYLIDETLLHFDISSACTVVTAELTIRRNLEASMSNPELVLDGSEMTTRNIWLDGQVLPPNRYAITKSSLTVFDDLRQACLAHNASDAHHFLLRWGRIKFEVKSLQELQNQFKEHELQSEIFKLE